MLPKESELYMTSPYFNITEDYTKCVVQNENLRKVKLIVASPRANGFYKSHGLSYWVAPLYRKGCFLSHGTVLIDDVNVII